MRLFIAAIITLMIAAGCTSSPADNAAAKAAKTPILALEYFPNQPERWDALSSSDVKKELSGSSYHYTTLEMALLRPGLIQIASLKTYPSAHTLIITAKGLAEHWSCKPGDPDHLVCGIPVGTMQIGKAGMGDTLGMKFVSFDCTPTANSFATQQHLDYPTNTNWNSHLDGRATFGMKSVCRWQVGPDGDLEGA